MGLRSVWRCHVAFIAASTSIADDEGLRCDGRAWREGLFFLRRVDGSFKTPFSGVVRTETGVVNFVGRSQPLLLFQMGRKSDL